MITNILDNFPLILISFVPGYLFLEKINSYYLEKTKGELDTIIRSVLISFLIQFVSNIILFIVTQFIYFEFNQNIFSIFVITMTYPLFYIYICAKTKFRLFILRAIRNIPTDKTSNDIFGLLRKKQRVPSVWINTLGNVSNESLKIRIKDSNLVYIGKLSHYTFDTDSINREILLYQFTVLKETILNDKIELKEIESYYNYPNVTVLLNNENIKTIEIIQY